VATRPYSRTISRAVDAVRERTVGFRLALERVGLPAWFVAIDLLWIAKLDVLAIDARHYQRAATEWLAGGNPWTVFEGQVPYLSGPHTLLFYAPTSLLPLPLSTALWMLLGVGAAVWTVRRLDLPLWWIAFPPLAHAIWNGNPQTLLVALLLLNTPVGSVLAAGVKLYALLPLLFRPKHLIAAGIALAITLPLFPWQLYLDQAGTINSHLATSWNGSAWRFPILIPPTLVALWILRRQGAEWFVVPAVFPLTQFYYVSLVIPAVARRPILAALLATPVVLMVPVVLICLATVEVLRGRSERLDTLADRVLATTRRPRSSLTR